MADFGFEGLDEMRVGLVEIFDILPLFVSAGSGEDGALPSEAVGEENGGVEREFLDELTFVCAGGDGGVGRDGKGETGVGLAPVAEFFDEGG